MLLENFATAPHSAAISSAHERWLHQQFKNRSPVAKHWLAQLSQFPLVGLELEKPARLDKSTLDLGMTIKDAEGQQALLHHQITARAGSSALPGHVFSASLTLLAEYGIFPDVKTDPLLNSLHTQWLVERKGLGTFSDSEREYLLDWYKANWEKILEFSLFGGSHHPNPARNTRASCLLLTDLSMHEEKNIHSISAIRSALVQKAQALLDLQSLSPAGTVQLVVEGEGKHNQNLGHIASGPFTISRDGGKKGQKSASNWKARFGRRTYLDWLAVNRPDSVFVC